MTESPDALPTLVVVTGYPGTGKTSMARQLSRELRLPLVSKDAIKEPLYDTLGIGDVDWSHRLGRAAIAVLHAQIEAILAVGLSVIAESNFDDELSTASLNELLARTPAHVLRVVLRAEPDALIERFRHRAETGERHPGHLDAEIFDRLSAMVREPYRPPDVPGELVEVEVSDLDAVDLDAVTARVRRAVLDRSEGRSGPGPEP